jgi:hydroxymethylpyrimidine pyrophosphatase-like HAD family hydrolase
MGNALPAAVEAAGEQTAHHMDDGVALVIEDVLAGLG